jgi:hypothetical protein
VEKERATFEEEKRLMVKKMDLPLQKKITLDVGGIKFGTSLATLRSIEGSMLASMFSGKYF